MIARCHSVQNSTMSFNFSDNEDEDLDISAYDDTGLLALASREKVDITKPSSDAAVATPSPSHAYTYAKKSYVAQQNNDNDPKENYDDEFENGGDDDGGDWDNVDWEDAEDDEGEDEYDDGDGDGGTHDSSALQNFPTQGVMINFGKTIGKTNTPDEGLDEREKSSTAASADDVDGNKQSPTKKRKRKITRVLRNVPFETQHMVLSVRRSGMLCSVVQAIQCSFVCGGISSNIDEDDGVLLSHLAYSMIPEDFHQELDATISIPAKQQLHDFSMWYFQFVNKAGERRRAALQRNVAQGASAAISTRSSRQRGRMQSVGNMTKSAKKQRLNDNVSEIDSASSHTQTNEEMTSTNLLRKLMYLSPQYDEDPQLFSEEGDGEGIDAIAAVERISPHEKVLLFLTMVKSLGWRARYVTALNPVPLELTVDHPLLGSLDVKPLAKDRKTRQLHKLLRLLSNQGGSMNNNTAKNGGQQKKRYKSGTSSVAETIDLVSSGDEDEMEKKMPANAASETTPPPASSTNDGANNSNTLAWVEVLCRDDSSAKAGKSMGSNPLAMWVPIHPEQESFDSPEQVESILAWMEMKKHHKNLQDVAGMSDRKRKGKWGNKAKSFCRANLRSANTFAKKVPVSYVVAVEHGKASSLASTDGRNNPLGGVRLTDVTPRYANTWSRTLRLRGATGKDLVQRGGKCVDEWWEASLKQMNMHFKPKRNESKDVSKKSPVKSVTKTKSSTGQEVDLVELESSDDEKATGQHNVYDSDEHEQTETKELTSSIEKEKIPTSKAAFKQSPFYVIPSVLNQTEVLHPDAKKHICGVFKGELVYRRSDVSKALRAKKWMYQGRKVREVEMDKPVKQIKARKKPAAKKGFQALTSYGVSEEAQDEMIASMNKNKKGGKEDDQKMDNLYGIWQTDPWSPPYVGPNDTIPTNEYRNVELDLINPGLTHMNVSGLAPIARKLGIPYAPCMMGYEGSHVSIRGIVVHDHNVALMQEASVEMESHTAEKERENKRKEIIKKWKRLVVGIMTKERLDREYG